MDLVNTDDEAPRLEIDFTLLEYDGFCEKNLLSRLRPFVGGRWTEKSLYLLYLNGLDCGSLEVALNSLGLTTDDLYPPEVACANRAYLMARAKTLAEVKEKLVNSSGSAKEAEVLLTKVYGITEAENRILGTGFNVTVMNEVKVGEDGEVEPIDIIEGDENAD